MKIEKNINQQIQNYLNVEKNPLICIVGPTATGKTGFGIEIANEFNGEIINCDSRQIFKEVECITGLDYEELEGIKNHFFGIAEVNDKTWTSAKFLEEVEKLILEIYKRKNIPVLVGGTGLFFQSLIEGFEIPQNSIDEKIRGSFKLKTNSELFEELQKVDFEYSEKTHPNNRNRVERALEFFYATGEKKSQERKNIEKKYNALIFSKNVITDEKRISLYEKINFRQEKLFDNSLEKISKLLKNFSEEEKNFLPALRSIGIPEINSYINGEISKKEAIEKTQQAARNYAKRQMTWRRKKEGVNFID